MCKMGHFESPKNVKKIQMLCFQVFIKVSKFACTQPSDFYFQIIDSQRLFFYILFNFF